MNPFARQRRRATSVLGVTIVVALVAAAVLGLVGYRAIRRYAAGRDVSRQFEAIAATPTGLWAITGSDGSLGSLLAVVGRGDRGGGHIVSIPIFANGGTPQSPISFATILRRNGPEALAQAVSAAVHLDFDVVQVSASSDVARLVAPVVPMPVTLVNDVLAGGSAGEVTLTKGAKQLDGVGVATVLGSQGRGSDASRSGNVVAVLRGLAAKVGKGIGEAELTEPISNLGRLLDRVIAGSVEVRVLGTVRTVADPKTSAKAFEAVDVISAILVFSSIAPAAMSAPAAGLVYRLEAPPGSEQRVMDAIALILFLGGNVTQVRLDAESPGNATVVTLYDDRDRDKLATSNPLFGSVSFGTADVQIEGIDAVIRLGKDYLSKPSVRPQAETPAAGSGG